MISGRRPRSIRNWQAPGDRVFAESDSEGGEREFEGEVIGLFGLDECLMVYLTMVFVSTVEIE